MSTAEVYPANFSANQSNLKPNVKSWGLHSLLLKQLAGLECGQLRIKFDDGAEHLVQGKNPGPYASIQIHKTGGLLNAILTRGALGFAESYMQGDWSAEDLTELLYMLLLNLDAYAKLRRGSMFSHLINRAQHWLNRNNRGGSRRNIAAHYDLGNDFYAKWLDASMSYSAAIFDATTDLAAAQEIKYANILNSLDPEPGAHILEIGCGWGGFAEYAAKWGMQVTAVTLSQEQFDYTYRRIQQAGLQDQVTLKLADYRTLHGQFDHIVSIEMFEAVGQQYWANYFAVLNRCLKPGGKVALQVITIDEAHFDDYCRHAGGFIQRYIFPGGMLPSKTHLRDNAWQVGLEPIDMACYGEHYADTLSDWQDEFQQQTDWMEANGYDEHFRRMWNYYLSYCEAGFREGRIDLVQMSLQKF